MALADPFKSVAAVVMSPHSMSVCALRPNRMHEPHVVIVVYLYNAIRTLAIPLLPTDFPDHHLPNTARIGNLCAAARIRSNTLDIDRPCKLARNGTNIVGHHDAIPPELFVAQPAYSDRQSPRHHLVGPLLDSQLVLPIDEAVELDEGGFGVMRSLQLSNIVEFKLPDREAHDVARCVKAGVEISFLAVDILHDALISREDAVGGLYEAAKV